MAKQKKKQVKRQTPSIELQPKKQTRLHCIFLFVLAFVIYGNTLNNGYVLDDSLFITGNTFTQKGLGGIKDIWTHDAFVGAHGKEFDLTGGRYRPLSITLFAIEHEFFGRNPTIGHFVNILLYAISGVLIYLLLLKLMPGKNGIIPLLVSTLFIAHPIHTEVVANIKSRDEIMLVLFLMLTLLALFKQTKKGILVASFCYLLALLSKETAITALAVIPLSLWVFTKKKVKEIAMKTLPFVGVAIFYLLLREAYSGGFGSGLKATNLMDNPYMNATFADKYATIVKVCGKYLGLLFFPHPLSFDYSYNAIPVIGWGNLMALTSLVVYLGAGIYAIIKIKERSLIAYGILVYLATFSIISNVFFNIGAPMGERFLFLPSLGFCIAVSALLAKVLKLRTQQSFKLSAKWVVSMSIIIPLAGYATIQRNAAWKSNYTLYETDVQTVPNSARARLFYGIELLNKYKRTKNETDIQQAIAEMTNATQINPQFHHAWYNLGMAYQNKDDYQNAATSFQSALQAAPTHLNSTYYLGLSYARLNRLDEGIELMQKAVNYGFDGPDGASNLGIAYGMKREFNKAIPILERSLQKNPNNANNYLNLGLTYKNMGNENKANELFQKAFELDPSLRK